MTRGWRPVGTISPDALVDARLQLHHAAQLVAAVGATLLPPRPDDGHPNLGWIGDDTLEEKEHFSLRDYVRYEDGSSHHPVALDDGPACIFFAVTAEGIDFV